jgi:hypothetical protein
MKDQQQTDYTWFSENFYMLYQRYGNSYLVIKNKTILGSYNSFSEAYHDTIKTESFGTFIIQRVCDNQEDLTEYVVGPITILEESNSIYSNNTDC